MAIVTQSLTKGDTYGNTYEVNGVFGRVERIAKSLVHAVQAVNPLGWMNKGELKHGASIEESLVGLIESTAYDPTETTGAAFPDPNIDTQYFNEWTKKQWRVGIVQSEILEVTDDDTQQAEIAGKIVGSLTESEGNEDYIASKALLAKFATDWAESAQKTDTATGADELVKALRRIVKKMGFLSNPYVGASGVQNRAEAGKIHIILPIDVETDIDAEVLLHAFNPDKADLMASVDVVDTGAALDGTYSIIVCDERAFNIYSKHRHLASTYNDVRDTQDYILHAEKCCGYSQYFPACVVTYTPDTTAVDILDALNSEG